MKYTSVILQKSFETFVIKYRRIGFMKVVETIFISYESYYIGGIYEISISMTFKVEEIRRKV